MNIILLDTVSNNMDTIGTIGKLINEYGFMIVFCSVTIFLLFLFFINYLKKISKKSDGEIEIINEERKASIEQNKQMFDLVTKVQTKQVVQLEEMTQTLRDIRDSQKSNTTDMTNTATHLENIKETMSGFGNDTKEIKKYLDELRRNLEENINISKENEKVNVQIMQKIIELEKIFKQPG